MMTHPVMMGGILAVWLYGLWVFKRGSLKYWYFLWGCLGLFVMLMVWVQPIFMMPLARLVAALSGFLGELSGAYEPYFKYGIIFVNAPVGSITMQIDLECSGLIEIFAFSSLLLFFDVYAPGEKLLVGLIGVAYLISCNALRITLICMSVHWFGMSAYYVVHTFVGRILFYALSVLLYYYVFTRSQIVRMKVGKITYAQHKDHP